MEQYSDRAYEHGQQSEPDHEVGDLQDMCRAMWEVLTPEQRAIIAGDPHLAHAEETEEEKEE